mmetsp:Transcript_13139/g.21872  ORF Transcript_13139/g.21872 Transcript_13139/m.21872 type:complete len:174 (+) Transcript_13139:93-614(+)
MLKYSRSSSHPDRLDHQSPPPGGKSPSKYHETPELAFGSPRVRNKTVNAYNTFASSTTGTSAGTLTHLYREDHFDGGSEKLDVTSLGLSSTTGGSSSIGSSMNSSSIGSNISSSSNSIANSTTIAALAAILWYFGGIGAVTSSKEIISRYPRWSRFSSPVPAFSRLPISIYSN